MSPQNTVVPVEPDAPQPPDTAHQSHQKQNPHPSATPSSPSRAARSKSACQYPAPSPPADAQQQTSTEPAKREPAKNASAACTEELPHHQPASSSSSDRQRNVILFVPSVSVTDAAEFPPPDGAGENACPCATRLPKTLTEPHSRLRSSLFGSNNAITASSDALAIIASRSSLNKPCASTLRSINRFNLTMLTFSFPAATDITPCEIANAVRTSSNSKGM